MIRKFILIGLISIFAKCQNSNKTIKEISKSFWISHCNYENISINSLEWNLCKSEILFFDENIIEFPMGIQYFPTRVFGNTTPYIFVRDSLQIFYQPEGKFLGFRIQKNTDDNIKLIRGKSVVTLERYHKLEDYTDKNDSKIVSIELIQDYDFGTKSYLVNLNDRLISLKSNEKIQESLQITLFETKLFMKYINNIDLNRREIVTPESNGSYDKLIINTEKKVFTIHLNRVDNDVLTIQRLIGLINSFGLR